MIGGGIKNTLDILGGQKIQDYLGGAGTATKGPGGGTLYTQGQERIASIPGGPGAEQAPQKLPPQLTIDKVAPGQRPLPYQGDSKYGSLVNEYFGSNFYKPTNHMGMAMFEDPLFGNYSSQSGAGVYGSGFMDYLQNAQEKMMMSLQTRLKHSPETLERFNLIGEAYNKMFPGGNAFYEANQMQLPKPPGASGGIQSGILGMLPAGPIGDPTETAAPGSPGPDMGFGPSNMQPILTPGVDYDAQANPFGPTDVPLFGEQEDTGVGMPAGPSIMDPGSLGIAEMPMTPQQPTGGFDSKVFANELLTGIGDLFKQHFPDSAQMAFNNSNQPQSQIEQPIQDATTFDVQPQQNTAYNPFSVNTIGGAFGGGY